jgi:hypothetical protein
MSKAKLEEARELIRAGRHNEARDILQKIDHPIAKEWLQKLNKVVPDSRQTNVYANTAENLDHPYESSSHDYSAWMRSTAEARASVDQLNDKQRDRVKKARQKEARRNLMRLPLEIGIVAISTTIAALGYSYLSYLADTRPGGRTSAYVMIFFGMVIGAPLKLLIRDKGTVRHILMVFIATYIGVMLGRYFEFLDAYGVYFQDWYLMPYWDRFFANFFDYLTAGDILFTSFGVFGASWILVQDFREIK